MIRADRAERVGIVLAGGRSSRMGTAKASLAWDGTTLLHRVVEAVGGAVDRVLVVRSLGQPLPALPHRVSVIDDDHPDRGPLQGMLAGLRAVEEADAVAFVCATDMPLLQPAFVARVLACLPPDTDAAVPRIEAACHPLAAAYRVCLAPEIASMLEAGDRRLMGLLERSRVEWLDARRLLDDPKLASADPRLDSLLNLNTPSDYAAAQAIRENGTTVPARPPSSSPSQASAVAPANEVIA